MTSLELVVRASRELQLGPGQPINTHHPYRSTPPAPPSTPNQVHVSEVWVSVSLGFLNETNLLYVLNLKSFHLFWNEVVKNPRVSFTVSSYQCQLTPPIPNLKTVQWGLNLHINFAHRFMSEWHNCLADVTPAVVSLSVCAPEAGFLPCGEIWKPSAAITLHHLSPHLQRRPRYIHPISAPHQDKSLWASQIPRIGECWGN